MVNKIRQAIGLALILCSSVSLAVAASSTDYQCDFPIADGSDSVRVFKLSEAVYRCSQQRDLSDMLVVNARGQAVPYSTITRKVEPKMSTVTVPFYREPQQANFNSTTQIQRILRASQSNPHYGSLKQQGKRYFSSMIVKLSEIDGQLVELAIDATPPQPLQVAIVMEVSNDLEHWRIIDSQQSYYFLPGEHDTLAKNKFKVPAYRGEDYMRLSLISGAKNFHQHIDSIKATINENAAPAQINWSTAPPPRLNPMTERWQYSWSGRLPVEKIRLLPSEQILLYSGRLYQPKPERAVTTRPSTRQKIKNIIKAPANAQRQKLEREEQWSYRRDFNQYWIHYGNELIVHDELMVNLRHQQQLELAFSQPSNIAPAQVPQVLLGWHDITVAFLAQGGGPYHLLVGQSSPMTMHQGLSYQIKGLLDGATELVTLAPNNHELDAPSQTPLTTPTSKGTTYLLWGVILLAIALLSVMVIRLVRSMALNDNDDEA